MTRSMEEKKAIRDEEGDVLLARFDLAFCSIDCMDPDGVKKKKKIKGKCRVLAEQDVWL